MTVHTHQQTTTHVLSSWSLALRQAAALLLRLLFAFSLSSVTACTSVSGFACEVCQASVWLDRPCTVTCIPPLSCGCHGTFSWWQLRLEHYCSSVSMWSALVLVTLCHLAGISCKVVYLGWPVCDAGKHAPAIGLAHVDIWCSVPLAWHVTQ